MHMRDAYLYLQVLKYYLYSLSEEAKALYEKINYYAFVCKGEASKEKLNTEIKRYLDNVIVEKKILRYIKKEFDYIHLNDMERFLDIIDENYEYRYKRLENILSCFDENPYYANGIAFREINKNDKYNEYLNFIHGFNKENVKEFIIGESIMDENTYDKVIRNATILNVDPKENKDMFGVFENNRVVIPSIKDDLSSLIHIHELIRVALLLKKDGNIDENIIHGEDLPIFYELLFKVKNGHIKCDIHNTNNAKRLLKDYYNEPFEEQIKRLKKYN